MSVVANVAINVDASGAAEQLKRVRDGALGSSEAFKTLDARAKAVRASVEASQGGFAKASTVQGVFSAKVKNTEQAIRAQIAALRNVQSTVQLGGALYQKAGLQIEQYEQALKDAKGAADGAAGGTNGFGAALGSALAPLLAISTAVEVFRKTTSAAFERSQAETRLKALTSAYGETSQATALATSASEKFGLTQTDATKAVADVYGRLRPLGFSLKEISGVYEGFNVLTKQAALSSAEADSVFTQLSQALGSGTLRGDEFNRMAESMPAILGLVSKELGVAQKDLRKMAENGKITSEVVVKALQKVAAEGGNLDAFLDPSAKSMNELAKNSENAQVAIGRLFAPVAIAGIDLLSNGLKLVTDNLKAIAQVGAFLATFAGIINGAAIATKLWAIATQGLAIAKKAAGIAAAFLQSVMNPAGLAQVALALGVATGAAVALGSAMGESGAKAEEAKGKQAGVKDELTNQTAELEKQLAAQDQMSPKQEAQAAKTQEILNGLQQQTLAINAQVSALERGASITSARYGAEKAINDLKGQQLEREYNLQTTAQGRLNIAVRIFQQQVDAARIELQQAKENIVLEQRKIELQVQQQQLKLKEIQAEGQLQILKSKDAAAAAEKQQQLQKALAAQQQVVDSTIDQGSAQQEIAKYQEQTAAAQYEGKILAAQTALEQKLVSDKIGLSQTQAVRLSIGLKNSQASAAQLSGSTDQVSKNALGAAGNFIRVATAADRAAAAISNAANQQARLNALQGQGGGAPTKQAAEGAYWPGGFKAFADGGVVTKPTMGLVGEGGEPEYIIPASKMQAAMERYASGQRGSSVIPTSVNPQVSVTTGPVMNMDGRNYVSQQDFMTGLQTASKRGAEMALQTLSSSYSARRAAGIA